VLVTAIHLHHNWTGDQCPWIIGQRAGLLPCSEGSPTIFHVQSCQTWCWTALRNAALLYRRGSSVGIATDSRLHDQDLGVRIPADCGNFSLRHRVQTGCGAHPDSSPVGTGIFLGGLKRPGREAKHSPPPSAEVKECVALYLHLNASSWHAA
jgi:hypothetical protein